MLEVTFAIREQQRSVLTGSRFPYLMWKVTPALLHLQHWLNNH